MTVTTKDFSVFDCDAHIDEYCEDWGRFVPEADLELVKRSFWTEGDEVLLNGVPAGKGVVKKNWYLSGASSDRPRPSVRNIMGPGMNKKLIRKLNDMDLTLEQLEQVSHRGSLEGAPRLKDMDLMGIDQVLIIPVAMNTSIQWVRDARGAAAAARAYNDWVRQDYCDVDPKRLFPAAVLAPASPALAAEEIRRTRELDFPVGLVRPIDAQGLYPLQPAFDPMWNAFEETGMVCGMHTSSYGQPDEHQFSPGQFADRSIDPGQITGPRQIMAFMHEGMTWTTLMLLSGHLERYPSLKLAVFEANASWLPMILESCDRVLHLYGNLNRPALKALPSETFRERCIISFEGDEEWVFRRSGYFEDVAVWSSDAYHHDGADAWSAIETMRTVEVPNEVQAKFMGGNARRFYGLEDRAALYTDRAPTEIPRPDWFPDPEDVHKEYALEADARAGSA